MRNKISDLDKDIFIFLSENPFAEETEIWDAIEHHKFEKAKFKAKLNKLVSLSLIDRYTNQKGPFKEWYLLTQMGAHFLNPICLKSLS